jgi:hypothetical protein
MRSGKVRAGQMRYSKNTYWLGDRWSERLSERLNEVD